MVMRAKKMKKTVISNNMIEVTIFFVVGLNILIKKSILMWTFFLYTIVPPRKHSHINIRLAPSSVHIYGVWKIYLAII
jgi:hypothetical protein